MEEDLARDSTLAKKESDVGVGLRKEATLTIRSAVSATGREGKLTHALAGPAAARWARPKRERGERREMGRARGKGSRGRCR
jgi:hypothetical protein